MGIVHLCLTWDWGIDGWMDGESTPGKGLSAQTGREGEETRGRKRENRRSPTYQPPLPHTLFRRALAWR